MSGYKKEGLFMKKASSILLTIGGVFHIVDGIVFISASIYFILASIFFFATGQNWFGFVYDSEETAEVMDLTMTIVSTVYIFVGLLFVSFGVLSFIASKLTFQARENSDKSKLITVLVISAILDCVSAVVGCIFGLIALSRENK